MRKRYVAFFLVVLLLILSAPASAHSGRTDGAGGHTNHSTGEYHYHHGKPAHDHYDMDGDGDVDCPYDFDDDTNHHNSVSGDSGKSFMEEYRSVLDEYYDAKQQREEEDSEERVSTKTYYFEREKEPERKKEWRELAGDMLTYILNIRLFDLPRHIAYVGVIALFGYCGSLFIVGFVCAVLETITKKKVKCEDSLTLVFAALFDLAMLLMLLYQQVA